MATTGFRRYTEDNTVGYTVQSWCSYYNIENKIFIKQNENTSDIKHWTEMISFD